MANIWLEAAGNIVMNAVYTESEGGQKMTTIIGMKTKEGVFLACDSQVTSGHIRLADSFDKVQFLGNTLIGSCGSVGLTQRLSTRAYQNLRISKIATEDFGEDFDAADFAKELSNLNFYLPLEYKRFQSAGFIVGGIVNGEPKIFLIDDSGANIEVKTFCADGSGAELALGLLSTGYLRNEKKDDAILMLFGILEKVSEIDNFTDDDAKVHFISAKTGDYKIYAYEKDTVIETKKD